MASASSKYVSLSPLSYRPGLPLTCVQAICTIIIVVYFLVAHFGAPRAYNYWAILALDIWAVIFWLSSFALLASLVTVYSTADITCDYYACYYNKKRDLETRDISRTGYRGIMGAAAGLGALEL